MFLKFIHVEACIRILFFFKVDYFIAYTFRLSICMWPKISGSNLLAVVNDAAINIGIQIPAVVLAFSSIGVYLSGIAGSDGNSKFNLKNYLTVFYTYRMTLYSH